ncbi:MAG: putative DNA binding domain-containing protein [Gammaproteobacteria bacterium]|nr:putative DNA binding domain-containing protein [Gammaproteobacteria bacterium]
MTTLAALQSLIAQGESETLEFKRSTAELRRAGETLCAFLNGDGGKVLIGVGSDGRLVGQEVADITLRDIAAMLGRFEPPARVELSRVDVGNGRQVIVLDAAPARQYAPFVFESRPYKRVGSTTTVMSQEEYARLLLDRNHSRHRWENQPAVGVRLEDLDREEILRTRQTAIEQRRLSAGTSMDLGDILDRLGLRVDGQATQAAQMLYGTRFLPDYPQGLLKLGRFRGTRITGDILDNKQEYLHAFAMVREAIAWLDRTLPLSARFPPGAINREDRLPVPAEALREIIINAVIHRDVSNPSSYVAIAVFDDRIEIHSIGEFPTGMRAELLTQEHRSIPRNPLIAGAFHRTGAIEVWGRGTNRVMEACRAYGIADPTFAQLSGAVTVTFRAEVVAGARDLVPRGHQVGTKSALSPHQVQVLELADVPCALAKLMGPSGRTDRTKFRDQVLNPLLEAGLLEMTIPDKPRSSKQRYRTTDVGRAAIATANKA